MTKKKSLPGPSSLSSPEITRRYLTYFREHNHLQIASVPLTASESTLFIIAGMQPLLPWLRGQEPPPSPRLTAVQRCLRTDDVHMVGVNGEKLSSFNMLGNWSIGDYGKREAVHYADEVLSLFGVDRSALWVTVFAGDQDAGLPPDDETIGYWRAVGQPDERIVPLGMDDNLWTMNEPGPCGPCTEMFIDRGEALGCGRPDCRPGCSCDRFLEFWNLVFIQYEWQVNGSYTSLPLRSVDTGMGVERIAAVLQQKETLFETDLFAGTQQRLEEFAPSEHDSPLQQRARRVIVDAVRSSLYIGLEGVTPQATGRGSVLRRLIRRASRQGRILGLEQPFLGELLPPLLVSGEDMFSPKERELTPAVAAMITLEEQRFARVLTTGLRLLERIEPSKGNIVSGEQLFLLHAERGFPADLAAEILSERGLTVDWPGFEAAMEQHHAISRVGASHRSEHETSEAQQA